MGQLINLMEEIRLRMQAGIDANDIESSHDNVYIGSKSQFLKMNDYPRLGIILPGFESSPECMRYGQTEDTDIQIGYMIPKLQDDYNILYKSSDSSGPLRNFEQIINYLVTHRTTGNPDLQLAGTAYNALKYNARIQEFEEELLFFSVLIKVKCGKYTRGGL